jgi:hypothetical protein
MFKKGDRVKWASQSAGSTTTKEGIIVRIVLKTEIPHQVAKKEFPYHRRMFDGWTLPGSAEKGYLIEVKGGKTGRAKPKLYMPYPHLLKAVRSV